MIYKSVFVYAPSSTYEKETFLGGQETKTSPHWIDATGLAEQTTIACNQLTDEGYEVVTITEITRRTDRIHGSGGSGGSVTHWVLVTARQTQSAIIFRAENYPRLPKSESNIPSPSLGVSPSSVMALIGIRLMTALVKALKATP